MANRIIVYLIFALAVLMFVPHMMYRREMARCQPPVQNHIWGFSGACTPEGWAQVQRSLAAQRSLSSNFSQSIQSAGAEDSMP
jgi:hypothetical protein